MTNASQLNLLRGSLHAGLLLVFLLPVMLSSAGHADNLPVYISDNHGKSFYWLADRLNWAENYQLLLFDRHSDASAVFDSDFIRAYLDNPRVVGAADTHFSKWKSKGIIQDFNWIEPLLPHPIGNVLWIPAERMTRDTLEVKKNEVLGNINQHTEVAPRAEGDLSGLYYIRDFAAQSQITNFDQPVIVSIDLDYFMATPIPDLEHKIDNLFDYVFKIRNLKAITIAVSRAYLKSDEQADILLFHTLRYLARVLNTTIYFAPFPADGPDRSELAQSLYRKRLPVPAYDIAKASSRLISLILQNPSKYFVKEDRKRWNRLLNSWAGKYKQPALKLQAKGRSKPIAACNYFDYTEDFTISIKMPPGKNNDQRITWKAVTSQENSYNVIGKSEFAANALPFLLFRDDILPNLQDKSSVKSDDLSSLFDRTTGFGTIRLFAEIERNGEFYRTKDICIARYANTEYTGRLTEIFNLPYILGSGILRINGQTGADAHYGADCLNFIIYGQRRLGNKVPYLNGNNLRQYLTKVDDVLYFKDGYAYNEQGKVAIDPESIKKGLLLHFGPHIAALYETNSSGFLSDEDLVIHQLENKAEIVKLNQLKQVKQPFMLMQFR